MAFMNKIGNILKQTSCKFPSFESTTSNVSIYQAIRCFSSSKLFIGGLSYATDEDSLREAFIPYGNIIEARIIIDRESGRSRGFGFISYSSAEEASAAIQALDGRDLHGRFIRVAHAADQRGTSRGLRFFGSAGFGAVANHTGGDYNSGTSNYGQGSGYDNHSSLGGGSTVGYGGSGYGSHNVGISEGNLEHASGGDYGRQDFSNTAGGNLDEGNNFDQDGAAGNMNDNGAWNDDAHRYANARTG